MVVTVLPKSKVLQLLLLNWRKKVLAQEVLVSSSVLSLVLLICDRESEEIFYKEREAEDEEGEEEKEEA